MSSAWAYSLSGTVTGDSAYVSDASVKLSQSSSGQVLKETRTNASGNYSFSSVDPGTYDLSITPTNLTVFSVSNVKAIQITNANITQDVLLVSALPYSVSGQVSSVTPLSSLAVSLFYGQFMSGSFYGSTLNQCNTMWNSGSTNVQAMQKNLDDTGLFSFPTGSDTNRCLGGTVSWSVTANGIGKMETDPSKLSATLSYGSMSFASNAFAVNANVSKNITLPALFKVTGKTTDANGAALGGVGISIKGTTTTNDVSFKIDSTITSDAQGNYVVYLPAMAYSFSLTPPISSGLSVKSIDVNVTGASTVDLSLSSLPYSVSGQVSSVTPLSSLAVSLFYGQFMSGSFYGSTLNQCNTMWNSGSTNVQAMQKNLDDTGLFSFPTGSDTNRCLGGTVSWSVTANGIGKMETDPSKLSATLSYGSMSFASNAFAVNANVSKNITLPALFKVTGKTTDANGVGISGVALAFKGVNTSSETSWRVDLNINSDAEGNYTVYLPAMTYSVAITPPNNSGFSSTTVPMTLSAAIRQTVILPFKDTAPPIIVSGPFFKSITANSAVVEWQTNEPTTGSVTTGNISAASTVLATTHSVQLTGLSPSTSYTITVSATDASGNGPTTKTATFVTAAAPDVTPPVIVLGPTITARSHNSLVVEWTTNEPAKGQVLYGTGLASAISTPMEAGYTLLHRAELTGLESKTPYQVRVTASDAAGNGPTTSRPVNGLTLPSPDTKAPVITNGPLITSIQDKSATVTWVTDEPSVSGVSWNDGTAYGVLTDPKLLTAHAQQITGLLPNTTYYLTVSSTDALGNGPTLSKTVTFKTQAAAQSGAPQVVVLPALSTVMDTSAVLTWVTDQPSSSVVNYGTTSATLNQTESQAKLVSKHSVTLVNLTPNTTYFAQVKSTSAAGKTSADVAALSFKTQASAVTTPPVFEMPPAVGYVAPDKAVVQWQTNRASDTQVVVTNLSFDEPPKVGVDAALSANHQLAVTGLSANSTYKVTVTSTDLSGNTVTQEVGQFQTPPSPDSLLPQIVAGPDVQTAAGMATITWKTDKLSDSRVSYGPAGQTPQSAGDLNYTKQHQVVLGNLTPSAAYTAQISSVDPSGNASQVASINFTAANADGTGGTNTASTTTTSTSGTTTTTVAGTTTTTQTSGSVTGGGTGSSATASTPINLFKGWNLIGNGYSTTVDVSNAFGDKSLVTTVWKWLADKAAWAFYAPSLTSTQLQTYAQSKGYEVLSTLNAGEGFWVNAVTDWTLTPNVADLNKVSSADFAASGGKPLRQGWSLIATGDNPTPAAFNLTLSATPPAAGSTPSNVISLWAWDAPQASWQFFAPSLQANGTLESYIQSKQYKSFGSNSLSPATGFWVNKP